MHDAAKIVLELVPALIEGIEILDIEPGDRIPRVSTFSRESGN